MNGKKKILAGALTGLMAFSIAPMNVLAANNTLAGTQKAYIEGDDWGPAVTRTILHFDKSVTKSSVEKEDFKIDEIKGGAKTTRKVIKAYTFDDQGKEVNNDSEYVTVEMYASPDYGNPFQFSLATFKNTWYSDYNLKVSLADNQDLVSNGDKITNINVSDIGDVSTNNYAPQLTKWDYSHKFKANDGITYSYADSTPAKDGNKHALVIWLHGAGEGGSDPRIDVLGNEVTALTSDTFQKKFGNAYVLAPQCPTMWMDNGTGNYVSPTDKDIHSKYTKGLFNLIDTYVKEHKDIDANRIIIGGCSNGGYMTMEMILAHPDYFAAAYPICEAYYDSKISDAELQSIKNMPIWFTYALNDGTVDPTTCVIPTVERLRKMNATDTHVSYYKSNSDTTGRFTTQKDSYGQKITVPFEYDGHWSWVNFFNNLNKDGDLNCWDWLAASRLNARTASATDSQAARISELEKEVARLKNEVSTTKTSLDNEIKAHNETKAKLAAATTKPADTFKKASLRSVSVKAYKTSLKVTYKAPKNVKPASYEITYATKKNGKYKKTTTKSLSKTIKKLKKNKTYYVRVRGSKKISGKTVYTKYTYKTVKTKK